jgi:bilirubin oxidase
VLAPFERIEILEDFGTRRGGTEVTLMSRKFSSASMGDMMHGMMGGMGGGMMQGEGMMGSMMGRGGMMGGRSGGMMGGMMGPDQGEELTLARFTIAAGPRVRMGQLRLPDTVTVSEKPATELHTTLSFRMMHGFLNDRRFQMTAVAKDERLPLEKPVVWTFSNDGPGMAMPHPMHIHDTRFRIIERGGINAPDLRDGIVDVGFKDTVLVLPGEHVKVAFTPQYPGLFLYHCHNLEHEDGGMMRNYLVS